MSVRSHRAVERSTPLGVDRRPARAWPLVALCAALGLVGCYSYTPLYTAPPPGLFVALELNDRGRVALEHNVGPEVAVVEGVLRTVSDSQLVVAVAEVRTLYGSRSKWAGELVAVRHEHVRGMRERRYSRVRTFALAAAVASSTVAFIVTRSLLGGGGGGIEGPPGGPGGEQ